MKRFFILALLVLSSFALLSAQEESDSKAAASDGITGFYGIDFGTTKDDVIKIMKSKGWKKNRAFSDKQWGDCVWFTGGTFASKKLAGNSRLCFCFVEDKFYMGEIYFPIYKGDGTNSFTNKLLTKDSEENEKWIKNVVSATVRKYNLKQTESTNNNTATYEGQNANQLILICSEKGDFSFYVLRYVDTRNFVAKGVSEFLEEYNKQEK
ncbi:MAG: hypothetical protein J5817_06020, partial [Treponema sp.]|nr:hypothetical protein [Treponema sp.]